MDDAVSIPVTAKGLTGEEIRAALGGDTMRVESNATTPHSANMDPATAMLIVGAATSVPALITAIANAWTAFFKKTPAAAAPVIMMETPTDDVVVRVDGDGKPSAQGTLPALPGEILRIHLT